MGNFAEQNINAAQDKTQDDQNPKVLGSDDSPPNDNDFFDDMTTALAGLLAGGAAIVTGLYGGSPTTATGGAATPAPSAGETVVLERNRRKEEEDGNVADQQDLDTNNDTPDSDLANSDAIDQMNPSLDNDSNDYENGSDTENPHSAILDPPTSVDNDISTGQGAFQAPVESTQVTIGYDPSKEYTMDGSYNLSQPVKDGILNILDGFIPDLSLPNLGIPDNILSEIASLLSGEGPGTPMAGPRDIPGWLRTILPFIGFPISFTESGNGNNSNDSLVGNNGKDTNHVKPLNRDAIQNSSESVRLNLLKAAENPNVNSYKNGESLKLNIPESLSAAEAVDFTREKALQLIKDAYFDYDGGTNSSKLLERFAEHNGLSDKNASPEQKQLYKSLQQELKTLREATKGNLSNARIDYFRENYARITAEKLVSMYGDKIDTTRTTGEVTYLKDGGMVLNNVVYDSQRDNETLLKFPDYTLRPGNQCSPTSVAMVMDYLGSTRLNDKPQLVDDMISQAFKDGILKTGQELKNPNVIKAIVQDYGLKATDVNADIKNGITKFDAIRAQLAAGNPVVVRGDFGIEIGGLNEDGTPKKVEGHILTIVGFDENGWIVHDPWGNANEYHYGGSGMYAHYDYERWGVGRDTAYTISEQIKE
ncbi:C39 family peptidase [Leptospira bourretii]|nr:C39 family peptidase [Leptospira bourretii]